MHSTTNTVLYSAKQTHTFVLHFLCKERTEPTFEHGCYILLSFDSSSAIPFSLSLTPSLQPFSHQPLQQTFPQWYFFFFFFVTNFEGWVFDCGNFAFWYQVWFLWPETQMGWCQRPLLMHWRLIQVSPFLLRSPTMTPLLLLTTMIVSPIIFARFVIWIFCFLFLFYFLDIYCDVIALYVIFARLIFYRLCDYFLMLILSLDFF